MKRFVSLVCILMCCFLIGCGVAHTSLTINHGVSTDISDEKFTKESLIWQIEDGKIVNFENGKSEYVGNKPMIIGKNPGKTTVTVLDGDKTVKTYDVTIEVIPATEIILATTRLTLTEGDTTNLSYTLLPKNASDYGFEWQSADPSVAEVDVSGNVSGLKVGETTIIISNEEGISEKCSVTVEQKSAYEQLSQKEKTFVDEFTKCIRNFKDPSSVRISGVQDLAGSYAVGVTATNGFGGASISSYLLVNGTLTDLKELAALTIWDDSYNLNLINDALQEFLGNK